MSVELEPMMAALNALARDTPRSVGERVLAADVQIKAWIAQTKDLSGRQRMLRDLDGKIALQEVDDFSTMLRGHVAQLLAAIRNSLRQPGDKRKLMDFRGSGAVEATAGKVDPAALAGKMANTIDQSEELQATYLPHNTALVRLADDARIAGRRRLRGTKQAQKVETRRPEKLNRGK
jgi:hypothetical protein